MILFSYRLHIALYLDLKEDRGKWIIYSTGSSLLERQIDCVHIFAEMKRRQIKINMNKLRNEMKRKRIRK